MCGGCNGGSEANGSATNGTNGGVQHPVQNRSASSPYQSVGDYLSNVGNFKIIESTLREGEQFANAFFDTEIKVKMYAPPACPLPAGCPKICPSESAPRSPPRRKGPDDPGEFALPDRFANEVLKNK